MNNTSFEKSCEESNYLCVLIQHLQNPINLGDIIKTNKNFNNNDKIK